MTMTNEKDSFGAVETGVPSIPLQTTGPFVAVTPNATSPDPRASAVFSAAMKKDLESRSRGEAS
jgi:hypothetical protein